ncbi:hypothetical protein LK10_20125 [Sinomonas humi]|uniref:4,4'-diaponeurosporenoate glycosyltransferase n=1 Tax=Sinomonas humi TaxID=1338436 RepID=A0A0B2AFG1_9MICC|nr:hypothetical protein LK10_20125 [Sinomonas humi]
MREVVVVIPAKDEEELLPRCLASVDASLRRLAVAQPRVRAAVVVALDCCRDGSEQVVSRWPAVRGVRLEAGGAGAARAAGVKEALALTAMPPEKVWIASTDADSAVPDWWLLHQLDLADAGIDLVLGTVIPDPEDVAPDRLAAWLAVHELADGHGHVFGANLGIRASAYLAAGGFPEVPAGEDAALAQRARELGMNVRASDGARVLTSGRLRGRSRGGFADFLAAF